MNYLKNSIYLIALSLTALSCNNKPNGNGFTIEGEALNTSEVYYGILKEGEVIGIDTATVVDNKFALTESIDSLGNIYMLSFDKGTTKIVLLPSAGEKINISYDATSDQGVYELNGSEESEAVRTVNMSLKSSLDGLDSLNQVGQNVQQTDVAAIMKLRASADSILDIQRDYLRSFIDQHPSSLSSLFALYQPHPYNNAYLLNIDNDFEYYEKVSKALNEKHEGSEHAKYLADEVEKAKLRIDAAKQTQIGSVAPEISLESPTGEVINLSDLRGKVVLVDFWASWCKPCRIENPNVVNAYNKYADKGFEVYSVSIDGGPRQPNGKADWINAISQDKLPWKSHVLDFGGNEVANTTYNVRSIPNTFLLDRDGVIIAKNLRGPALEAKLEEVL